MKKFVKVLVIFIVVISMAACGKKSEPESEIEKDAVILEGIKYELNQDDNEYGIKYKIASNFRKTTLTNAVNYFSENIDDKAYFVIRIFHYKNKSIDYAIDDSTTTYDKKYETKINNLDYTVVHFIDFTKADVNIYYHKHNDDVYAFAFTSGIDISKLEELFLKSIEY